MEICIYAFIYVYNYVGNVTIYSYFRHLFNDLIFSILALHRPNPCEAICQLFISFDSADRFDRFSSESRFTRTIHSRLD